MSQRTAIEGERRSEGLRELRLLVPDARHSAVRQRVAEASARLFPDAEQDALAWIVAVSDFDNGADDSKP